MRKTIENPTRDEVLVQHLEGEQLKIARILLSLPPELAGDLESILDMELPLPSTDASSTSSQQAGTQEQSKSDQIAE